MSQTTLIIAAMELKFTVSVALLRLHVTISAAQLASLTQHFRLTAARALMLLVDGLVVVLERGAKMKISIRLLWVRMLTFLSEALVLGLF